MIRRVEIKNFRCLRDVAVDFEPLTVLVGPNGSGKSTLLRALRPDPWTSADHWQRQREPAAWARFDVDGAVTEGEAQYGRHPSKGSYDFQEVHLDVNSLRRANQIAAEHRLAGDGSNLTNVFETLTRKQQEDFARRFCLLVPTFADIDAEPVGAGQKVLRFQDRWNPEVWYYPTDVSDGTMLMVAYLALTYQSPPAHVIAIEEPERGLHPYLIGELIRLLRDLATGALGTAPIQVVLATHSAELLEHVRPEEVRFFDRDPADGAVTISRVDTRSPDWSRAFEEYRESLGSVWLSGGLGGVPTGSAQ